MQRWQRSTRAWIASLALGLAWSSGAVAQPDVPCASLPNPIYGIGGSAPNPLIGTFAAALAASDDPITVIYQSPGACFLVRAVADNTPLTGTATYWTTEGQARTCTLPLDGVRAEWGSMGNTAALCDGFDGNPPGLQDVPGPVTTWTMIVPTASSQTSISSEAIYMVYGFGDESSTAPWTDESQIFTRNPTSAAGLAIAIAAGLPPSRLAVIGTDVMTNGNMVTRLSTSTNPEAAIGFVSGETADARRDAVRVLAYQHRGQSCGYTPDSSVSAFDKINVREGRYWLWAFHRFFYRGSAPGTFESPRVERFIRLITGEAAEPDVPSIQLIADNGNVPLCAMEVTRTGDYTPLVPYSSPVPCRCYFDFATTGESTCATCSESTPCASGTCRLGFCEAR